MKKILSPSIGDAYIEGWWWMVDFFWSRGHPSTPINPDTAHLLPPTAPAQGAGKPRKGVIAGAAPSISHSLVTGARAPALSWFVLFFICVYLSIPPLFFHLPCLILFTSREKDFLITLPVGLFFSFFFCDEMRCCLATISDGWPSICIVGFGCDLLCTVELRSSRVRSFRFDVNGYWLWIT